MLDEDDDGFISLDEFVNKFMETRAKLEQRKQECAYKMIDHDRQAQEVEIKLEQSQVEEPRNINEQGIRKDSKLKVHIVDAVNLESNKSYRIKVFQDNSMEETKPKEGPGPIWNEAILFDIADTNQPVVIQLVTVGGRETVAL